MTDIGSIFLLDKILDISKGNMHGPRRKLGREHEQLYSHKANYIVVNLYF